MKLSKFDKFLLFILALSFIGFILLIISLLTTPVQASELSQSLPSYNISSFSNLLPETYNLIDENIHMILMHHTLLDQLHYMYHSYQTILLLSQTLLSILPWIIALLSFISGLFLVLIFSIVWSRCTC